MQGKHARNNDVRMQGCKDARMQGKHVRMQGCKGARMDTMK